MKICLPLFFLLFLHVAQGQLPFFLSEEKIATILNDFIGDVVSDVRAYNGMAEDHDLKCFLAPIRTLLQDFNNYYPLLNCLLYTGKQVPDIGDQDSCSMYPDNKFVLVSDGVDDKGLKNSIYGICAPQQCKLDDIRYLFNPILNVSLDSYVELHDAAIDPLSAITFVIFGVVAAGVLVFTCLDYRETNGTFEGDTNSELTKCFSVGRNAREVFYSKEYTDPHLCTLDGLCVVSMMWVICASGFYYFGVSPLTNKKTYEEDAKNDYYFHVMLAAVLTIDVFFFISGFHCALKLTERLEKASEEGNTLKAVFLSYLHRLLRLLPLYLLGILIVVAVVPFIYSGMPLSSIVEWQQEKCKKNFWQNIFFVQNLFGMKDSCMPWTGYFAADFQLFLIAPLLILLYNRNKKLGVLVSVGFCVGSLILQIAVSMGYNLRINEPFFTESSALEIYYAKPYNRLCAFLIGILLGWHYLTYKNDEDEENAGGFIAAMCKSFSLRVILLIIGAFLVSLTVSSRYFLRDASGGMQGFYIALGGLVFLIGVLLMFYPALLGKSDLIYNMFGASVWKALKKLTFGAYMFHITVILAEKSIDFHTNYYTFLRVFLSAIHVFVIAYFVSLVLTLFFEAPLRQLQRVYLFKDSAAEETTEHPDDFMAPDPVNTSKIKPLLS